LNAEMSEQDPQPPAECKIDKADRGAGPVAADRPLTVRQRRFVEEYLIDLNGTQAAIRAGHSSKTAKVTASQLLPEPNLRAALEAAVNDRRQLADADHIKPAVIFFPTAVNRSRVSRCGARRKRNRRPSRFVIPRRIEIGHRPAEHDVGQRPARELAVAA
jgi:phage terminase small subunit